MLNPLLGTIDFLLILPAAILSLLAAAIVYAHGAQLRGKSDAGFLKKLEEVAKVFASTSMPIVIVLVIFLFLPLQLAKGLMDVSIYDTPVASLAMQPTSASTPETAVPTPPIVAFLPQTATPTASFTWTPTVAPESTTPVATWTLESTPNTATQTPTLTPIPTPMPTLIPTFTPIPTPTPIPAPTPQVPVHCKANNASGEHFGFKLPTSNGQFLSSVNYEILIPDSSYKEYTIRYAQLGNEPPSGLIEDWLLLWANCEKTPAGDHCQKEIKEEDLKKDGTIVGPLNLPFGKTYVFLLELQRNTQTQPYCRYVTNVTLLDVMPPAGSQKR